ncbi:MAG: hypothetical protein ACE5GX_07150 [Thermoanaerobaculia bacterium]
MRRWTSSFLVLSALVAPAATLVPATATAQETQAAPQLVAYAYNLQHRGASEALELVLPLLSSRGAVELQPGGNALVVRDTESVLELIRPRLRAFDHPFEPLRIRVQVIRAEPTDGAQGDAPELPAGVLERLRELLKYESYSLLAGSEIRIDDGMAVVHDIGDKFRVDFRLRHLLSDERASLEGFRLSLGRDGEFEPLIHANLNLDLDKPMVLGLAPTEASDTALMLVIECLPEGTAEAANR